MNSAGNFIFSNVPKVSAQGRIDTVRSENFPASKVIVVQEVHKPLTVIAREIDVLKIPLLLLLIVDVGERIEIPRPQHRISRCRRYTVCQSEVWSKNGSL